MKKVITFLVAMVMCLNLFACGGPDKQPAIDAYNELVENYNKFVDYANEDLDSYTQEEVDMMNSCADVITEYGEKLDNGTELTQEEVDEIVDMFVEFNGIIEEFLEAYE